MSLLDAGVNASKQVAYAWAVSLGGEAGAKLLTKFGLIEQAIDYATESGNFDQAFQLARTSMKTKLPEVINRRACMRLFIVLHGFSFNLLSTSASRRHVFNLPDACSMPLQVSGVLNVCERNSRYI